MKETPYGLVCRVFDGQPEEPGFDPCPGCLVVKLDVVQPAPPQAGCKADVVVYDSLINLGDVNLNKVLTFIKKIG